MLDNFSMNKFNKVKIKLTPFNFNQQEKLYIKN